MYGTVWHCAAHVQHCKAQHMNSATHVRHCLALYAVLSLIPNNLQSFYTNSLVPVLSVAQTLITVKMGTVKEVATCQKKKELRLNGTSALLEMTHGKMQVSTEQTMRECS